MTRNPVVRIANAEDQTFLREHDSHVHTDVLRQLIDSKRILVVESAGVLLGWLRWNLFWDETPFMNMLFVLEAQRGRGLGGALMDAWEAAALREGHKIVMTSSQADEEAQHVYRKRGYVDCGAILLPGQPTELVFRKELSVRADTR